MAPAAIIDWTWHALLCAAALGLAYLLLTAIDIFVIPRVAPRRWLRPLCWLFDHIEGQAFEVTEDGFFDICTRCGHRAPGEGD